jgi:CBS domain containing-hemolysin-like protein
MASSIYPICIALVMAILAGLFAGAEIGVYRLSRVRLRLGIERGQWFFVILGKVMQDSRGFLLSLLVATILAEYVATSIVTGIFLDTLSSEYTAEFLTTLVVAPILFVFSELIPKNVFLQRADQLTPLLSPLLWTTHRIFTWCGIVPLLRLASVALGRLMGSTAPTKAVIDAAQQHRVLALLAETREEGLLSPVQSDIIDRIVNIPHLRLSAVTVPLSRVQSFDVHSDGAALQDRLRQFAFTRFPVWEGSPTQVIGFIHVYDVLTSSLSFDDLHPFVQPISHLDADMPVIDAIQTMRRAGLEIVLVTRTRRSGRDIPLGIVTMKDLVEEFLGELAEW